MKPKIIRLYGKADSYSIEFTNMGGGIWQTNIPPDLTDGQYAVTLTALNEAGEQSTWTGILYMCEGVCCMKFNDSPYQMWVSAKEYTVSLCADTKMIVRKGCCHV